MSIGSIDPHFSDEGLTQPLSLLEAWKGCHSSGYSLGIWHAMQQQRYLDG